MNPKGPRILIPGTLSRPGMHSVHVIYWDELSSELDVSILHCQEFLLSFLEEGDAFATESESGAATGTILNFRRMLAALNKGKKIPIAVDFLLREIIAKVGNCDYLWMINPIRTSKEKDHE
jgi:hypothetical protein